MRHKMIGLITILMITPFLLISQPTIEEIQESIDLGTTWLVAQQDPVEGFWGFSDERVAYTGFALTKLCDRAYELGYESPFDPTYNYSGNVIAGFNYLFSQARDDKTGIYMAEAGAWHETYNAAIALIAISASYTPTRVISTLPNPPGNPVVDGLTFAQLVDQMVIYFEWGQQDDDPLGWEYGGWRYQPNGPWGSDNSHAGYVVLALRFAEAFGATIPQGIKDKLTVWIDYIQNDQGVTDDGGELTPDGGSGYASPDSWVNQLKTGNLLFEMSFFGDAVGDTRVQFALDYIERHWYDPNGDPGWQNHIQSMFCLMKGFESFSIETIEVGGFDRNWFEEFATYLVGAQVVLPPPDDDQGYWVGDWYWGDDLLNTCWALFVLERVAPPPPMVYVDFDVHPTSWPNPINTKSQGLTPTAILGTEDFDVTTIDVETLYLDFDPESDEDDVYPVNWAYEDVTMPAGNEWECNDTEEAGDGYMDLTLKFNTQELVAALGEVNDGDELVIIITGMLIDGQNIEGDDCILIKKKGNKAAEVTSPTSFDLTQNYPNPFSSTTTIKFQLPEDTYVTLKVYDMMGNEIATIADNSYMAGDYSVVFDATHLSNGVYIYRIITSDHTATKQMLLSE